ncbi:hypothetical protein [Jiulongibacter sp. NS-SX5]|uniref:hypothetical protein n=1 Tax=Jiulongibacter sp. NS-SX5 TaxID=3463854 RepID=UPI0040584E8E
MFVGHYAPAFLLKSKEPKVSLGALFIATQFVDILFFPFTMLGIEHLRFVDGFTEVNNFDMHHMPYTHGLVASLIWAVLFGWVYSRFFVKKSEDKKSIAVIIALGVLSHWFVDLLVHTPDLPLVFGDPKVGFGLWNFKNIAFGLEVTLLIICVLVYVLKNKPTKKYGLIFMVLFTAFLIIVNYLNFYILPKEENLTNLTISALLSYFAFAGMAHGVDKAYD